jgi:hypothetical protein
VAHNRGRIDGVGCASHAAGLRDDDRRIHPSGHRDRPRGGNRSGGTGTGVSPRSGWVRGRRYVYMPAAGLLVVVVAVVALVLLHLPAQDPVVATTLLGLFNGSIINDKFCLSHWSQLRLSWPRARVTQRASLAATYPPDEQSQRGGGHETPVAGPPDGGRRGEWTTALGSRLPTPHAMGDDKPAGTGTAAPANAHPRAECTGGVPCV